MASWISLLRRASLVREGSLVPAKKGSRSAMSESPPYSDVPSHRSSSTRAGRSLAAMPRTASTGRPPVSTVSFRSRS